MSCCARISTPHRRLRFKTCSREQETEDSQESSIERSFIGLPRHEEALAVKDDAGFEAESTEDGYDLKRDQAGTTLQSIGFSELRVEFFNALGDDPETFRVLLLDIVIQLRLQHQLELQEMIEDALSLVANFEQEQMLEVRREAARHLETWLKHNEKLDFATLYPPERSLMRAINRAHASSVRASVRRQGEWYNLDYSHQLSYGARLAAAHVVGEKLSNFYAVIDNLLQDDHLEEAVGLLRQARRVVDAGSESLLKKCQIEGKGIHVQDMKPSTELWDGCDSEWGRGPGYRDRVSGRHQDWFDDDTRGYKRLIQKLIEKEWQIILARLSAILEIT